MFNFKIIPGEVHGADMIVLTLTTTGSQATVQTRNTSSAN